MGVGRVTSHMSVTPDMLSTLCSDMLPTCVSLLGAHAPSRTLSSTLTLIGGISGGHLLGGMDSVEVLLRRVRPRRRGRTSDNGSFVGLLRGRVGRSMRSIFGCDNACLDCDLSSSASDLGVRPCVVYTSRGDRCIGVNVVGTCGSIR